MMRKKKWPNEELEAYLNGTLSFEDLNLNNISKHSVKRLFNVFAESPVANDPAKYYRYLLLRKYLRLRLPRKAIPFVETLTKGNVSYQDYSLLAFTEGGAISSFEETPTPTEKKYGTYNRVYLYHRSNAIASCRINIHKNIAYATEFDLVFLSTDDEFRAINAFSILLNSAFIGCVSINVLTLSLPLVFEHIIRKNGFITNGIFYRPWNFTKIWEKKLISSIFLENHLPNHIYSPFIIVDTNRLTDPVEDEINDGWVPKDMA